MAQNNHAREQVELAMASILIRTPSVISRLPDDIINSEEMLSTRELSMFIDLSRLENQVEHRDADLVPTISDWRRFWRLVFRRWNTTHPDNESPASFVGDLSSETAVKVGTLMFNHPPNKAYPGPQPKWRQEGADVFLGVSIPQWQGWLDLLWKDSKGKPVKPSIVKLDMELCECLDLAIARYDRCVQDRVEKYNEDCIIATARRRLVHFAKTGTGREPRILSGDEAPVLMPVVLAGDRADKMANTFANLKDLRDQRAN
ncbi:hypothetical protein FSPOR_2396 [Fusarium sporotrichioides]|uniref:Uncharacterized protein n=1 Tax=Fusarium sporotrichioides TaxID=5514 RepID=A0A395SKQ1_FUSSP|nr:hypothetical protein FSPOR_2396 [Fusarium sporotrichioides]